MVELRGVLVDGDVTIEPFGDPARDMRVLDLTLGESIGQAMRWAGAEPTGDLVRPGHRVSTRTLAVEDTLYVGRLLLRDFLRAAGSEARGVLTVADGPFSRGLGPLQELAVEDGRVLLPVYLLAPGDEVPAYPEVDLPRIPVDIHETTFDVPVPAHYFGEDKLTIPVTGRPFVRILDWSHVLAANRVALAEPGRRRGRVANVLRILWAIVRAGLPTVPRVLRKLSKIHPTASVHPSAVIEASYIGPKARVGPNALVRFSHVAEGSWLMPGSQFTFSVAGRRSLITSNSVVNFCVLYPEATAAHPLMQLCLLGERCITTGGGYIIDMRFGEGNVKVLHRGEMMDSGTKFLGACLGHDVVMGTGIWMAHGRAIPNGYHLVKDPSEMLLRVPQGLPTGQPLAVRGTTLEPVSDGRTS